MKYTLPKSYTNAGLQVIIPDTVLRDYRTSLGSTKAAVDKWLYENGYMAQAEYMAAHEANEAKKPAKREFKIDQEKADVVSFIAKCLPQFKETMDSPTEISNIEITNPNRVIAFSLGDNNYELTLVRKKAKK